MNPKEIQSAVAQATVDQAGPLVLGLLQELTGNRVAGLAWHGIFNTQVSNTHDAPWGHPKNFAGSADRPRSYPGFSGRVWLLLWREAPDDSSPWESRNLTRVGIRTGTGGSGTYGGPFSSIHKNWHDIRGQRGLSISQFAQHHPEPLVYSWYVRMFSADWRTVHQEIVHPHLERELRRAALAQLKGERFEAGPGPEWKWEWLAPGAQEFFDPNHQQGELA